MLDTATSSRKHARFRPLWISLASLVAAYAGLVTFGAAATMQVPRVSLTASAATVGVPYQDVSFLSRDGAALLRGWFFGAGGGTAIIVVNGGFQNRVDSVAGTLGLTRDLVGRGYSVLLFDLRGRGESGGVGRPLSNMDADIGAAVDFLRGGGFATGSIAIVGYCSGAAEAAIFASRNEIGALVLDGAFAGAKAMVVTQAEQRHIPGWLAGGFVDGLLVAARLFYGFSVMDPVNAVSRVSAPIFFMREGNDRFVSWDETVRLRNASPNRDSSLWQIPDTGHSLGYTDNPREYVDKVDAFLRQNLK
jgi:pimeloyl-ACP methyl ester carboxylesterase